MGWSTPNAFGGFGLASATAADDLGDLVDQRRLRERLLRLGEAEVGEDVIGASGVAVMLAN